MSTASNVTIIPAKVQTEINRDKYHQLRVDPITQTHADLSKEELDRNGITDRILRLSVGIEGAEDLIADLEAVLK